MTFPTAILDEAQRALARADFARALALSDQVLASNPDSLPALAVNANAANATRDFATASRALTRLCRLLPADAALRNALAVACNNLGSVHFHRGDIDAAAAAYERALGADPNYPLALTNLAACAEKVRDHAVARRCLQRLLAHNPDDTATAVRLSRALRGLGDVAAATSTLVEAERRATSAPSRREIGIEYLRLGEHAHAMPLLDADDDAALAQIAGMRAGGNDAIGARRDWSVLARRAAHRGDTRAQFRAERDAVVTLPWVFDDAAAIARERADFAARLDRFIADWPVARLKSSAISLDDLACSRFALAYQGGDDKALATRHGDWLSAAAGALYPPLRAPSSVRRVRRIGLVGARWNQGTIAAYFGSWPGALRRGGFEVCLFSLGDMSDATSAALAAQVDHSERLPSPLAAAAARLRDADCDLLIYPEVGLSAPTEVLAALRLAPRQWAAWGHPVTTGLPTIDRFLSVATMEPANAATHYRETLALLPALGTRYARPPRAQTLARSQFGLSDGPLYAVPHSPIKLHPDIDAMLVDIARRDRDAQFAFVEDDIPALTRALRLRVFARMRAAGLDGERHCRWLPRLPINAFRNFIATADVVLDALHFSGGNTSLDALGQGTPVFTVEGDVMRGRQTAAMLRLLAADALILRDATQVAAAAVELAHTPRARAELSARLLANAPRLFDCDEALHALVRLVESAD